MLSTRQAVRDDARAVARVHDLAGAAYYGVPIPEALDPDRLETWSSVLMDRRRATVLVGEDDGDVIAFVAFGPPVRPMTAAGPVLELHGLYVLPDYWGQGLGSRLHASFVKRLALGRIGALEVWDGSARAIGFYQRRGWRPDGRVRPASGGHAFVGMVLAPAVAPSSLSGRSAPSGPG